MSVVHLCKATHPYHASTDSPVLLRNTGIVCDSCYRRQPSKGWVTARHTPYARYTWCGSISRVPCRRVVCMSWTPSHCLQQVKGLWDPQPRRTPSHSPSRSPSRGRRSDEEDHGPSPPAVSGPLQQHVVASCPVPGPRLCCRHSVQGYVCWGMDIETLYPKQNLWRAVSCHPVRRRWVVVWCQAFKARRSSLSGTSSTDYVRMHVRPFVCTYPIRTVLCVHSMGVPH